MVEVHKVSGSPFDGNVYLILDEVPVLIDAGMDPEPTLRKIKKHIDPADIEMIILTHCHHDHSAGVPLLKEATGAKVLIHENEAGSLGDDMATVAYLFGLSAPEIEADETLKEGDVIDLGEWKLEVMHTPGHSPGGICLYEPRARVLFSGDTVFPQGNIGRTDLFAGKDADLVRSIERLTELEVEVLYPGHMEIVSGDVGRQIQASLRFARSVL
ncbi:MBL fold metallo-hydrolase [Methanocrinis sp.]|uniref:MBL fold metallo-hydrolase n=1 Tax=Methanocrinis sp. TaxID=3101522 RepID=UPI003D0D6516